MEFAFSLISAVFHLDNTGEFCVNWLSAPRATLLFVFCKPLQRLLFPTDVDCIVLHQKENDLCLSPGWLWTCSYSYTMIALDSRTGKLRYIEPDTFTCSCLSASVWCNTSLDFQQKQIEFLLSFARKRNCRERNYVLKSFNSSDWSEKQLNFWMIDGKGIAR